MAGEVRLGDRAFRFLSGNAVRVDGNLAFNTAAANRLRLAYVDSGFAPPHFEKMRLLLLPLFFIFMFGFVCAGFVLISICSVKLHNQKYGIHQTIGEIKSQS